MDPSTLQALIATAVVIGFTHTVAGPDHYVPFIAMSRVGGWSWPKTMWITMFCGVGHVLGSIVLGAIGIGLGLAVVEMNEFESSRGDLAGWLLLGFGLAYTAWGIRRAIRNQPHSHRHEHLDGTVHHHEHRHQTDHVHLHTDDDRAARMTPWILFTIFVFGPCETLVPLLMFPAAKLSTWGVVLVTLVFGLTTIATMTSIVMAAYFGATKLSFPSLQRYSHTVAGLALTACGAAIHFGL